MSESRFAPAAAPIQLAPGRPFGAAGQTAGRNSVRATASSRSRLLPGPLEAGALFGGCARGWHGGGMRMEVK